MNSVLKCLLIFSCVFVSFPVLAKRAQYSLLEDIAYGPADRQKLDIYLPQSEPKNAAVIFMVHGGGWMMGDKSARGVVKNKVAHWLPKGFIFMSVNYRLLPDANPVDQAEDVAKALSFAQQNATRWGAAPDKFILMGHSAGAHLVALLASKYSGLSEAKLPKGHPVVMPWLGMVALDTAAYDVPARMTGKAPRPLYKKVFGAEPRFWKAASPINFINKSMPPSLVVCSSIRKDGSCEQASRFVEKVSALGARAKLLPVPLSHRDINVSLGEDSPYTRSIDAFLETLHPTLR